MPGVEALCRRSLALGPVHALPAVNNKGEGQHFMQELGKLIILGVTPFIVGYRYRLILSVRGSTTRALRKRDICVRTPARSVRDHNSHTLTTAHTPQNGLSYMESTIR